MSAAVVDGTANIEGGFVMNWDAIGAIAEAIGAAAVVASLLYLARQIRSSARASAVESKLQTTRLLTDTLDAYIQTPEVSELVERAFDDPRALSKQENIRFSNLALRMFWAFSAAHFQFRTGAIAESDWREVMVAMHFWLRGKGTREWWEKFGRGSFGPEFQDFVDREINANDAAQQGDEAGVE